VVVAHPIYLLAAELARSADQYGRASPTQHAIAGVCARNPNAQTHAGAEISDIRRLQPSNVFGDPRGAGAAAVATGGYGTNLDAR
jgi:hypothetical protein